MLCQPPRRPTNRQSSLDDDDLQSLEWLQNFDISRITNFLDTEKLITQEPKSIPEMGDPIGPKRKPLQCTFSCMIFRAIEESPHRALPLQSIYRWIEDRYPYFVQVGSQWKNSVRHNLSLNQCFIRLQVGQEDSNDGTSANSFGSSWWTVHPDFRNAYGSSVLARGSAHTCLPRGICGSGTKKTAVTHLSTSEHELAVLANDIKAAATILTLKEPLGASNRSRSTDGNKIKASKGSQCKKKKLDRQFVVSHGVAEDHRYISENTTKKQTFTISSLIDQSSVSASSLPSKFSKTNRTADACVQVCDSDFIDNRPFITNARPKQEAEATAPKRKRTRRYRK